MRRQLNHHQRWTIHNERQDPQSIHEAFNNGVEIPECQICVKPLTTNTKVKLNVRMITTAKIACVVGAINHKLTTTWWYGRSMIHKTFWNPLYVHDSSVFECPTLRCEYDPFHNESKTGVLEPKECIAKLHVGDLFDRQPGHPITIMQEFNCLDTKQYQNPYSMLSFKLSYWCTRGNS